MRRIERLNTGRMEPGQDLVVAGYAGLKGTRLLVEAREAVLRQWFTPSYMEEIRSFSAPVLNQDPDWMEAIEATEWEQIGEGGIFTALWNLSGGYERGISFALRKIPLRQETVEVCERFELNPYRLMSGDCLLLVTDNGGRMVERLRQQEIPAVVIGYVNDGISREIIHEEGRGYLERPQRDELWKVLKEGTDHEREDIGSH